MKFAAFARRLSRRAGFRAAGLALLFCAAISPGSVLAQEPDKTPEPPILRLEIGAHLGVINQISMDAAQKYLVSASHDKTVRVWDRATGKLLQTLRPPIGSGNVGMMFAVALSPDGAVVACGGLTSEEEGDTESIYLFDRASGRMTHRIRGVSASVYALAYSIDGKYLAATLADSGGLRVYRAGDGRQVAEDRRYGGDSNSVDFDRSGRMVTTCDDGFVRLYSADFRLLKKVPAPDGKKPYDARFSPFLQRIAVGYYDSMHVSVLSGDTLAPLYRPDVAGLRKTNLCRVCWSGDGSRLYAGGDYGAGGKYKIRCWQNGGKGAASEFPAAQNMIEALLPLHGGGVAFASYEPTLGILDGGGKMRWQAAPPTADFRGGLERLLLSSDAGAVQFGFASSGRQPARYRAAAHQLEIDPPDAAESPLHPPRLAALGLKITDWADSTRPRRNGVSLPLDPDEDSYSFAIAPDGEHFLLGTDATLRHYDSEGAEVWTIEPPGTVWAVNVSWDGRLAVASLSDGTLRWYQMKDGAELLAFFPCSDKKRWVAWTPSGYYDCSPGGEDLIGWHVSNGPDAAADFYSGAHFRAKYCRPDVVERILSTLDEDEALWLADEARTGKP